jgi:hypothetical protein
VLCRQLRTLRREAETQCGFNSGNGEGDDDGCGRGGMCGGRSKPLIAARTAFWLKVSRGGQSQPFRRTFNRQWVVPRVVFGPKTSVCVPGFFCRWQPSARVRAASLPISFCAAKSLATLDAISYPCEEPGFLKRLIASATVERAQPAWVVMPGRGDWLVVDAVVANQSARRKIPASREFAGIFSDSERFPPKWSG